jgi:cytochrome c oxidase subunit II
VRLASIGRVAGILVAGWDAPGQTLAGPMTYLRTFGPRADPATALTWGLILLSLAVAAIITVLVVVGAVVRRRRGAADLTRLPASRGTSGYGWFYVGMPLTIAALVGALVWTVDVLAAIDSPPVAPRLTIEVTGHQWWWEVRYLSADTRQTFVTANEIHIPTGEPVLVKLIGADVIHSFWIPALTGKTDTVPGQTNVAWLQTARPGVYHGQCAEYCGVQHAHMGLEVVAQPPAVFEAWRSAQLRPAPIPSDALAVAGEAVFVAHCGACHAVQGLDTRPSATRALAAGGVPGPDLSHLMARSSLAAETVPNTIGGLSGWIANPQGLKPGTRMPTTYLSGPELSAVVRYLETRR